jgi:hypothetical protein
MVCFDSSEGPVALNASLLSTAGTVFTLPDHKWLIQTSIQDLLLPCKPLLACWMCE